ncbi:MAG: AmmeMemoRadiSam system protein A, partial [Acidiferrobacterales bacterium]|nr:AmmeMemoRadiSam system protein A [Acidiferrobacterales bacterium]
MSSSEPTLDLSGEDRRTLVQLARASIESGLYGNKLHLDPSEYSASLQRHGASFVTIRVLEELRGCIGSIEARRVLVVDVVKNAHAAAFSDPRFGALTSKEFEDLNLHISVLSEPQELTFTTEDDLIRQLRPGIDGVILEEGS